jgi:hypothetical protein
MEETKRGYIVLLCRISWLTFSCDVSLAEGRPGYLCAEHLIEEGKDPSSSHQTPALPGHAGKEVSAAMIATVQPGDTMWSLSERLLGKSEDWQCK